MFPFAIPFEIFYAISCSNSSTVEALAAFLSHTPSVSRSVSLRIRFSKVSEIGPISYLLHFPSQFRSIKCSFLRPPILLIPLPQIQPDPALKHFLPTHKPRLDHRIKRLWPGHEDSATVWRHDNFQHPIFHTVKHDSCIIPILKGQNRPSKDHIIVIPSCHTGISITAGSGRLDITVMVW